MDIDLLKQEIADDEGCVYEIYRCSEGYPTFGIGHLVTMEDPEFDSPEGTEVSEDRVHSVFLEDIEETLYDCEVIFPQFYDLPEEAQRVICNMTFQLGRPKLTKFRNFIKAVNAEDWQWAAEEMEDSLWAKQTPNRFKRLQDRILALT